MRPWKKFAGLAVPALALALAPGSARGVDQPETPSSQQLQAASSGLPRKGSFAERFRLGFTTSFYSGLDKIRSESANFISFRDIGINDGSIAFEPRIGGDGRISLSPLILGAGAEQSLGFTIVTDIIRDPRKDFGSTSDTALEETLWASLSAAYDIKTWKFGTLYTQLDAGYYSGDAGNIEVAVDIAEQAILNPADQDLTASDPFANYQFIYPSAGTLTQMPVSLSGMWQFRPRSPFRPYVGVGLGYLNASLSDSPSLDRVNGQLAGIKYSWTVQENQLVSQGVLPARTIVTDVRPDWFYVAQGGLEYNINRHWSVYFDTRFISTPARVTVQALGFNDFGEGIKRSQLVFDVDGIGSAQALVQKLVTLSVEDAVRLIDDILDRSSDPRQNEASFYTSFPVALGDPINIEIPNPIGGQSTTVDRQTKLFVHGGDIQLDSYSVGFGVHYRF